MSLPPTDEQIIHFFCLIVKEYFQNMMQSELLNTIQNSTYIVLIGLNTIVHIFKITLQRTMNIELTCYHCQKAYYCYLEYVEQMNKTNLLHNLNNLDAIMFVYKKSLDTQDNINLVSEGDRNNIVSSGKEKDRNFPHIFQAPPLSLELDVVSPFRNNSVVNLCNIAPISMFRCKGDRSQVTNHISIITKTVLFFIHEINIEKSATNTDENKFVIKIKNNNGEKTEESPTLVICQMYTLYEKHLKKYLLWSINGEHTFEYIFEYIQFIQEKIQMNFEEYDAFLLEVFKKIKTMKKNGKIISKSDISNKQLQIFYTNNPHQESIQHKLNALLETKKYSVFVKILFDE